MKIQYFPETDSLTFIFSDRQGNDSYEIEPGIIVDIDENKNVVGIEFESVKGRVNLTDLVLYHVPVSSISFEEKPSKTL